jgi:hypothetical protein
MDGLQRQRTRRAAGEFASRLQDFVAGRVDTTESAALGAESMAVSFPSSSQACRYAAGAFLPSSGPARASLALAQAPFAELDLPLEWCRPWIPLNIPVPAELTHPYRIFLDAYLGFIHVHDSRTNSASILMRTDAEIDGRTLVAPFRTTLNWLARSTGATVIHAAAVSVAGAGVLIAGPSGSGKSTAALALACSGNGILGDDSIVLSESGAHALYRRAKIADDGGQGTWPIEARDPAPGAPAAKTIVALDRAGVDLRPHSSVDVVLLPQMARRLAARRAPLAEVVDVVVRDAQREVKDESPRDRRVVALALRHAAAARVNVPEDLTTAHEAYAEAIACVRAHA